MRRAAMKLLLVAGAATLALAGAGQALAAGMQGTVVGKERARHALVITGSNAIARTVRVGGAYRLRPGARVSVQAGRLRDGTHRATAVRIVGRSARARVHGTVLKTRRGGYLLSAGKSVLAIRYRSGQRLSSSSGAPRRGDQVVVRVSISRSGALTQQGPAQTVAHGARTGGRRQLDGAHQRDRHDTWLDHGDGGDAGRSSGCCDEHVVHLRGAGRICRSVGFPEQAGRDAMHAGCRPVDPRRARDAGTAPASDEEEEEEVEGAVTALTAATATATGSITVGSVTCTIPAGYDTLDIQVGDDVEIECEAGILTDIEKEGGDEDED